MIVFSINKILWRDDVESFLNRSQGDQEVKNKRNLWHVYYNHFEHHVCPLI